VVNFWAFFVVVFLIAIYHVLSYWEFLWIATSATNQDRQLPRVYEKLKLIVKGIAVGYSSEMGHVENLIPHEFTTCRYTIWQFWTPAN